MDLEVSPALLDAMQRPPREPERGVVVPAGVDEPSAVEEVDHPGSSGVRVVVEAPLAIRHPMIAPPRYGADGLPADLRETAAVHAAVEALRVAVDQVEALRVAVDQVDGELGRDAAAGAWYAESVVRFFCSTYGGPVVGVRVNEDSFIVIRADMCRDEPCEVTIAVGPGGTCACKVSSGDGHRASAAPDVRAFEQVLARRMAEAGVHARVHARPGHDRG